MEFINSIHEYRPLIAAFLVGGACGYIVRAVVWKVKIHRQVRAVKNRKAILITSNDKSIDTASLRNSLKYAKIVQPNEQDLDKLKR